MSELSFQNCLEPWRCQLLRKNESLYMKCIWKIHKPALITPAFSADMWRSIKTFSVLLVEIKNVCPYWQHQWDHHCCTGKRAATLPSATGSGCSTGAAGYCLRSSFHRIITVTFASACILCLYTAFRQDKLKTISTRVILSNYFLSTKLISLMYCFTNMLLQ